MIPMERLSSDRAEKLRRSVWLATKAVDRFLYVLILVTLKRCGSIIISIRRYTNTFYFPTCDLFEEDDWTIWCEAAWQKYCKELVDYWESL